MCADVDECATGSHQCGDEGNCIDSEGGYSCLPVLSSRLPRSSSITGTSSELKIEPTATVVVESPTSYYGRATSILIIVVIYNSLPMHALAAVLYDIVQNYWLPTLQVQVLPL